MSKVKIQGNTSGTAIFTVAAPATNTNRTITLPDVDATVLTTAGGTISGAIGIGANANSGNPLTIGRVNTDAEGGQIDLCRSSDNASSWGIDVYGNTSTPSLRIIDNGAAAVRLSIDNAGRITTPNQPSLQASRSSTVTSIGTTILWDVISHNTGNHYNSSNGTFTAPIAGKYLISIMVMSEDTAGTMDIAVVVNGNPNDNRLVPYQSAGPTYSQVSGSAIFNLSTNDSITVRINSGEIYGGSGRHCSFCIHFLG